MSILEGLQPERVFYYFEEICKIPHGSYNTKEISNYLVNFAKNHQLEYCQDENNNVIIFKQASKGYEDAPVVILQGHCDMVCEKTAESKHDFTKDGLQLWIDGDFLRAKDTTLGGDDGIAVAYALAILEDDMLKHPALEVVITTDEEVGLLGAAAIDTSHLKGTYMINIDSEEEGKLWTSCAGGLSMTCELPVNYIRAAGVQYHVKIDGLTGGHSGAEIDKIRGNAIKLMGRFLMELSKEMDFRLTNLVGGQKDNAIPRSVAAGLIVEDASGAALRKVAARFQENLRKEYRGTDEKICVTVEEQGEAECDVLSPTDQNKIFFYLVQIPYGVQKMSGQIEGLVETSMNPGILKMDAGKLTIIASIRSSVGSARDALAAKVQNLTEFLGGTCTKEGEYPAWEYREDSELRDIMAASYKELFGKKVEIEAIHAGLECGLFYEKIPNLDCVSFGPTMHGIHTTEESLSISSTERMWNYLIRVLENIRPESK